MIKKHLGETIDLHTGGVDLLFPHHENEIAQSQCCNGQTLARHWFHNEHLLVDGKKMSKSEGTLYTLDDLKKVTGPGMTSMAVRYSLLQAHPRKQQNFTLDAVFGASEALFRLGLFYLNLKTFGTEEARKAEPSSRFEGVIKALSDDLNFPAAFGALFTEVNKKVQHLPGDLLSFERALFALGIQLNAESPEDVLRQAMEGALTTNQVANRLGISEESLRETISRVRELAKRRWAAKQAKDFAEADALRKELAAAGWSMLDRKDGYSLEPVKK
jgi:cysteinyl-tRNA synthetase